MSAPRAATLIALLGLVTGLGSCGESNSAPRLSALLEPQPGDPEARAEAKEMFANACALCHGSEGRGNGPRAGSLSPRPRSYWSRAWQDSVTDERLRAVIRDGGAPHGLSTSMPGSPESVLSDAALDEIVRIIRELGRLAD